MPCTIILLLVLSTVTLAFHTSPIEDVVVLERQLEDIRSQEGTVLNRMKSELEILESNHLTTRAARVQGTKKRLCGKRLSVFIQATCGECEPGTDTSLSVLCCHQPCDMHQIIGACCPSMLNR